MVKRREKRLEMPDVSHDAGDQARTSMHDLTRHWDTVDWEPLEFHPQDLTACLGRRHAVVRGHAQRIDAAPEPASDVSPTAAAVRDAEEETDVVEQSVFSLFDREVSSRRNHPIALAVSRTIIGPGHLLALEMDVLVLPRSFGWFGRACPPPQ